MKKKKNNPVKEWFYNVKNTKQNFKKVRASPYATLEFSLKVRKMIIYPLMIFIAWKAYDIIVNYSARGFMNTVGKVIMFGVFAYLLYRIYRTIPDAKKQIEYYKKYPNVINYCPTDVKEDIDDILNKIKLNQEKEAEKKQCSKKQKNQKKK